MCKFCGHTSCRRIIQSHRPPHPQQHGILAGFLKRHHDWIIRQYFAADYGHEIISAADTARQLLNPTGTHVQKGIAPCEEEPNGARCPGELYAIRRDSEELLPSSIKCDRCGVEVPSTGWVKFGRRKLEREKISEKVPA